MTFELTFANRDLVWLGDPGSPTAMVYIQTGARPIATDLVVTTLVESHQTLRRNYMHEARIAGDEESRVVYAFTKNREQVIGAIDKTGRFLPNDFYAKQRDLLPTWPTDASLLAYDASQNVLYYEVEVPGPVVTESLDFLPLELFDTQGQIVVGRYAIEYVASQKPGGRPSVVSLTFQNGGPSIALAKAALPGAFRRNDVQLDSFDNHSGTYLTDSAYREDADLPRKVEPSVTFKIAGKFTSAVRIDGKTLALAEALPAADPLDAAPAKIVIDGKFDDWRNVSGVDDRRGDLVPYLVYVPDVDLLEFKVAHDDKHIYLYARVAGQVGRSHFGGGRSYFYAYMDVDRNPATGFLPSRDDDCYFGVDLGDDCEVQFEFVNSTLRKTFYGFCGIGGDDNVLKQKVTIGKSQYGRLDEQGVERANYKAEYIYRNGVTEITEDLKLGTSDTIRMAVSPDGSEVEVVSDFAGFLTDPQGRPTVALGQTIDIAVGMECDSKAYRGKTRWAADNTAIIRGYHLHPADAKKNERE